MPLVREVEEEKDIPENTARLGSAHPHCDEPLCAEQQGDAESASRQRDRVRTLAQAVCLVWRHVVPTNTTA